jgi:hypothetical protein
MCGGEYGTSDQGTCPLGDIVGKDENVVEPVALGFGRLTIIESFVF